MNGTRPAPKPTRKLVSRFIRESARGKPCSLRLPGCEPGTETVVLAHLRGPWAGIAQKPHDTLAVYACASCHRLEEAGGRQYDRDRLRALHETHDALIAEGIIAVKGAKP